MSEHQTSQRQPLDPSLPDLPWKAGDRRRWGSLPGAAQSLVIAEVARASSQAVLVITENTLAAERVHAELDFFLAGEVPILRLPDWETLIYDSFSPHQDIISARLAVFNQLPSLKRYVLVVPMATLLQRTAPKQFILGNSLQVKLGDEFDLASMRRRLQGAAYRAVETVFEHGEYAVRGALMDIFPMGSPLPFRIELLDDQIETIRIFDPETQRSTNQVDGIDLLPAREFPLTDAAIRDFQDQWYLRFQGDPRQCYIYRDVSDGISPPGIEYYLPLFFKELGSLLDYLPEDTLVFCEDIEPQIRNCWQQAQTRYDSLGSDLRRPILPPEALLLGADEFFARLKQQPRIDLTEAAGKGEQLGFAALPDVTVNDPAANPLAALAAFVARGDKRLLIAAETNGRREVVDELLTKHGLKASYAQGWQDFAEGEAPLAITVAPLERGLLTDAARGDLALISEQQLFGGRVLQSRRRIREREQSSELAIKSLTELSLGAPVVHLDHGIGRYQGLQTLEIDGQMTEFLTLTYQDEDKLYVPVASLHLISRYTGAEEAAAPLDRLGSESWQKAKRKAAEQVHDVAAELLSIYARRQAKQGYAYPAPDAAYESFVACFPFEETPDQETAISSVIADMTNKKAMDRLICGDVGFGKTEVAMRAAFLAVQANKQVAVLVPTTLLAGQHTETFKDRFADWPVRIDSISRFKTGKEQAATISKLKEGKIDIIVGTHALIQEGVEFKDLGLLIIDEEHRFGVRQKEKIKSLRAEVDILTLTATPIPRTLNMALADLRDLSIIATPPAKRLSIKTFVREYDEGLAMEAIQRELMRGGQIYYLHNEVKTIERTADKVRQLAPQAVVDIGHGQMRERKLEKVMSDFYHKRTNILVCTTIIETGIDIPNANTIIMDRADKFGLAQIHQLRGRVGRSHHQAYAYLFTPHSGAMTEDAKKRLEAIADADALGAGFILATHDLEIRGAGELLGDEQTGNMQKVGFSLYMRMLDRAVKAIQDGKTPNLDRPLAESTQVNLHLPALIPEAYVPDVHTRLVLYKRIANAETNAQLRELQVEMIDRFGLLPAACKTLFRVTQLKLLAEAIGISKVEAGEDNGRLVFDEETTVEPGRLVELMQAEPSRYRLTDARQLRFEGQMLEPEARFAQVEGLLNRLTEVPALEAAG